MYIGPKTIQYILYWGYCLLHHYKRAITSTLLLQVQNIHLMDFVPTFKQIIIQLDNTMYMGLRMASFNRNYVQHKYFILDVLCSIVYIYIHRWGDASTGRHGRHSSIQAHRKREVHSFFQVTDKSFCCSYYIVHGIVSEMYKSIFFLAIYVHIQWLLYSTTTWWYTSTHFPY